VFLLDLSELLLCSYISPGADSEIR